MPKPVRPLSNAEIAASTYESWRAQIPFTDEQIIQALEDSVPTLGYNGWRAQQAADRLRRTGRLASYVLSMALPFLIKHCGVCGKTAHYRYGREGRCQAHKHITSEQWQRYLLRIQAGQDAMAERIRQAALKRGTVARLKATSRAMKRRRR